MKLKQTILIFILFVLSVSANAAINLKAESTYCVDNSSVIHLIIDWKRYITVTNGHDYHKIVKVKKYGRHGVMIESEKYINTNGEYANFILFNTPKGSFVAIINAATYQYIIPPVRLFCRDE